MKIKSTDLVSLFEEALTQKPSQKLDEIGVVLQVGDNICTVSGLEEAVFGVEKGFLDTASLPPSIPPC